MRGFETRAVKRQWWYSSLRMLHSTCQRTFKNICKIRHKADKILVGNFSWEYQYIWSVTSLVQKNCKQQIIMPKKTEKKNLAGRLAISLGSKSTSAVNADIIMTLFFAKSEN